MFKVSEIISKEVISIYECESIGTIKNVILNSNLTKVLKFIFFNDDTDTESCVLINNLYSLSEDGILVKNLSKIDFNVDEENNPINKKIYTISANDFGKIKDIIIDKKGNVIKYISTKDNEILPTNVISFGSICIANDAQQKIKISSFKPRSEFIKPSNILDNIQVHIVKMDENIKKGAMPTLPIKIKPNVNTLLGKKVSKTITGLNNEIIIRENNIISKHTIDMAKIHNKTNELIYNSL